MLIQRKDSLLLIVDVQENIAPVMDSPREVINNCAALVDIAKMLNVPFVITEQYPKGLGPTMIDIRQSAGENTSYLPKIEFSCAKNKDILKKIKSLKKKQIIIAGIEAHVCVLQTAVDFKELGFEVFMVADACSSRDSMQHTFAMHRLSLDGVRVVTSEMVALEWLEKAGTEEFKTISQKYLKKQ